MKNLIWNLIIVPDPEALPGKNLHKLIETILKKVKFEFVILQDIHGAGIFKLFKIAHKIIKIEELMSLLFEVVQFDWGDFFLFKEFPKNWNDPEGEDYPYVIAQTDTTIRTVDDGYFYYSLLLLEIIELLERL